MLSDEERRDLLDMAASASLREDCRRLRSAARAAGAAMDADALLAFLSAAARLGPTPPPRPPPLESRMLF